MAKNIYLGIENISRKAKKLYIGIDGKARKVKKAYIGVDGTARQIYSGNFEFSYTGQYEFTGSLEGNWQIKFLTRGMLTIKSLGNADKGVDLFLLGGGAGGGRGSGYWGRHENGGSGGSANTYYKVPVSEGACEIVVGDGGDPGENGKASSAFGRTAGGGTANIAAGAASNITDFDGRRYGGDGGKGGWSTNNYVLTYSQPGGAPHGAAGGQVGSTTAGTTMTDGQAAAANTGGGGGGGGSDTGGRGRDGGKGGSGIVIMRNSR